MTTCLPLVSVVIPTYNRWPMIGEAVESVLTQTFNGFELIVVDDGSTDNTRASLSQCDSRLKLFSQPRTGVAAARNAGVPMSRGKYIAFLDSDDLWLPGKLAIQTISWNEILGALSAKLRKSGSAMGSESMPNRGTESLTGDIFQRSLELCLVSPSAVMMTKELFYWAGGFDESFPVCEDYDLWLRIAVCHPGFSHR